MARDYRQGASMNMGACWSAQYPAALRRYHRQQTIINIQLAAEILKILGSSKQFTLILLIHTLIFPPSHQTITSNNEAALSRRHLRRPPLHPISLRWHDAERVLVPKETGPLRSHALSSRCADSCWPSNNPRCSTICRSNSRYVL
jgi:hypothetical protein